MVNGKRIVYTTVNGAVKIHLPAVDGVAEIIVVRANPNLSNMGMNCRKGERIRKEEVSIANNFLIAEEVYSLNLIVTMFFDTSELHVRQRQTIKPAEWEKVFDTFLANDELTVRRDAGRVSADDSEKVVEQHYIISNQIRKEVERTRELGESDIEEIRRIAEND